MRLPLFVVLLALTLFARLSAAGEKQARLFEQVWRTVQDNYYDPKFNGVDWNRVHSKYRPLAERAVNDKEIYPILDQMVSELKDAHTRINTPDEVREERSRVRTAFGFALRLVENQYIVNHVEPQSSMSLAGVTKGWVLRGVDSIRAPRNPTDRELAAWYAKVAIHDKCLSHQTVRFEFLDVQDQSHDIATACTQVGSTPKQEALRLAGGILYVRFDRFAPATGAWFAQVLDADRDAAGLIIDLRTNPGGLKAQLLKVLDTLYAKPMNAGVDVTRKGKEHNWKVHGRGARAFTKPVVVLVDDTSMSSSEILASTIQETGRGRVIGRKTKGKVLLSYEIGLSGGGRLQLAIRDYRTEKGVRLEGRGVTPGEIVPLRATDLRHDTDRDLERAQAVLAARK